MFSRGQKILLVNPWIYDFAAYDYWLKPYGLLCLAAYLRRYGYVTELLDCLDPRHPGLADEQGIKPFRRYTSGHGKFPKEEIAKPESLLGIPRRYHRYGITPRIFRRELHLYGSLNAVFVTSLMTYWYPGAWEAIRIIREELPGVPIVLGGIYPTLCPDHAQGAGADIIVAGRGEDALPRIIQELFGHHVDPGREARDDFPYPAFDLLRRPDQLPLLTSRGCPYRCSYCASYLLHGRFYQRDPDVVIDEIAYWHGRLGVRHFSFYDDALLVHSRDMAVPMLKEIIRRQLPCQFHCPNGLHAREITSELALLFRRAGFTTIRLGFETADADRQAVTGGKVVNAELQSAVNDLRTAGYRPTEIGVYLLCGLPGQTAWEVEDSIVYVRSCGARPIIAEYSPIPRTGLWPAAVAASPYPLAQEPLFHNNTLLPCRWEGLTEGMYRSLKRMTREKI
jgi:radical SAM superfamily enzyme YgiQ (UPF0313 family)